MQLSALSDNLANVEQYLKLSEKTIRCNPEDDTIEDYHLIPQDLDQPSPLSNQVSSTRVNGLLSINRNEITDIELAVVESDSRVYRTSFSLDRRWRLCQIHETQMTLKKLIADFMLFKAVFSAQVNSQPNPSQHTNEQTAAAPTELSVVKSLLRSFSHSLTKLHHRLSLPAANSLRSLSRSKLRTIFKPDLPKNLLLNVYCRDGNVNIDLNFIEVSPNSAFNKNPNNKALLAQVAKSLSTPTSSQVSTPGAVASLNILSGRNIEISSNFHAPSFFKKAASPPAAGPDGQPKNELETFESVSRVNKVAYEVGDEFSHPGMGNAVFRVVNTTQMKAEISWLYIAQNLIKEAVDEVVYCLKCLE